MVENEENSVLIALSTINSEKKALEISKQLVERKIAACVNIIPNIKSIFRWKGEVQEESEWLLVIKTRPSNFNLLEKTLNEIHSYDVPELLCWSSSHQSKAYAKWVREETNEG